MAEKVGQGAGETELDAEQVRRWAGFRLDGIGTANVGKVEGAFVDEASGEPVWVLTRLGRFGHHTLVPARDAVEGVGRVWVPYTRDQIREAPKADSSAPLTAAAERILLAHYGIESGGGRAAQLGGREEGTITAKRG
jgi:hypothetical protein